MSAPKAITDFHNHLVPGVDDGARDAEESATALVRFRAEGATQIITTPHFVGSLTFDASHFELRMAELDEGWDVLREVAEEDAERSGAALRVERGVELMLDVPDPDLSDPRLRLAGGPFALVEYPTLRLPPVNAEIALSGLRGRGWIPVVAHPERYRNLDPSLAQLARFRDAGAYLQLSAGSLFGEYGRAAAEHARSILARGWADYVASDYHAHGDPGMARFVRALGEAGYAEQAELLAITNPGRILAGEWPLPVPPVPVAQTKTVRSWWARLLGAG